MEMKPTKKCRKREKMRGGKAKDIYRSENLVVVPREWVKKQELPCARLYKPIADELSQTRKGSKMDLDKMSDEELDELSSRAIGILNFRGDKGKVLELLEKASIDEASGEKEGWMKLVHDDLCIIIKKTKQNEKLMEKIFFGGRGEAKARRALKK